MELVSEYYYGYSKKHLRRARKRRPELSSIENHRAAIESLGVPLCDSDARIALFSASSWMMLCLRRKSGMEIARSTP